MYFNCTQNNNILTQRIYPQMGFIGQLPPLNMSQSKKIIDQMSNSVCRVVIGNKVGTGFLCLVPFPSVEYRLKVLITCNHVFNDIRIGNKIKIMFDNGIQKEIIIDGARIVYTSKREEYDITIIELEDNEFDIRYYLGIDDDLFLKDEIKINQQIYIIHYPNGVEVKNNQGTIQNKIGNKIIHYLTTYEGSSGAPIFNLNSFKVIAIHCGYINNKNNIFNIGELIKIPINDFYQKCKLKYNNNINNNKIKEEKTINEINIILEISYYNINKIIYFLDNTKKHDNLKELNENNVKLYINNKEYKYTKCFKPDKVGRYQIKLLIFINMINCSYFFYNCKSINQIIFTNFNTNNVIDMSHMLDMSDVSIRSNLSTLSDISKWNTNKVINMSYMFYYCSSLLSLPDISKWNTNNVIDMSGIFCECKLLSSLPDISKWNTNKVNNISFMFYECLSLSSLPDISKWNTNNVTDMSYMLYGCNSLTSLPDISKWNTNNVINMSYMFKDCVKLSSLPDISKWNTNNVTNMSYMLYRCNSLTSLPDISKWNTNKVTNMSYMFYYCYNLSYLPDISKWNTNNVIDMKDMFDGCYKLKNIPSKFEESNCIIF